MNNMSTHQLVSIAVQAAEGNNSPLFQRTLDKLREQTRENLLQGICSIIIILEQKGVNSSFKQTAQQIFDNLK